MNLPATATSAAALPGKNGKGIASAKKKDAAPSTVSLNNGGVVEPIKISKLAVIVTDSNPEADAKSVGSANIFFKKIVSDIDFVSTETTVTVVNQQAAPVERDIGGAAFRFMPVAVESGNVCRNMTSKLYPAKKKNW